MHEPEPLATVHSPASAVQVVAVVHSSHSVPGMGVQPPASSESEDGVSVQVVASASSSHGPPGMTAQPSAVCGEAGRYDMIAIPQSKSAMACTMRKVDHGLHRTMFRAGLACLNELARAHRLARASAGSV